MPCDNEQLNGGRFFRRFRSTSQYACSSWHYWLPVVLTFLSLYLCSISRKQFVETVGADIRKLGKKPKMAKLPTGLHVKDIDTACALEYCKEYPDVAGFSGTDGCNSHEVYKYHRHWLLHGRRQNRLYCGNFTTICDRIWRGDFGQGKLPNRIDIVVAHCTEDMKWLEEFIEGVKKISLVKKITIISKCSRSTQLAPRNAKVITIPNVGRNDHTYAFYIVKYVLVDRTLDDDDIVFFIKGGAPTAVHGAIGDSDQHRDGVGFIPLLRPPEYALKIASATGFACMVEHYPQSLYHSSIVLNGFSLDGYKCGKGPGKDSHCAETFKSNYTNLSEWLAWSQSYAHAILPRQRQIVPVCYEGNFVARVRNIRRQRVAWKYFEEALRRGDNIEEGHFMERTWAMILKDEADNSVFEIPHHAEQLSKTDGAVTGRYEKCTTEYRFAAPEDVRFVGDRIVER